MILVPCLANSSKLLMFSNPLKYFLRVPLGYFRFLDYNLSQRILLLVVRTVFLIVGYAFFSAFSPFPHIFDYNSV